MKNGFPKTGRFLSAIFFVLCIGCNKLVEIPAPINSLTASQVFNSDNDAISAVTAIYSNMSLGGSSANLVFSNGGATVYTGLSSDELADFFPETDQFLSNTLQATNTIPYSTFWQPAYFDIYMTNAVIFNLNGSSTVTPSLKGQLIGEAEFLRALSYFYLTNLYGDVPLVLSTDFHQTDLLARNSQAQVYAQIVADLNDAQMRLASDFSFSNGEHTRANKWAATALLARAYLYNGNWKGADSAASAVINSGICNLLSIDSLSDIFLPNSSESILQFQTLDYFPWATAEGYALEPAPRSGALPNYQLQSQLVAAFEPGDQRWLSWVDSVEFIGLQYYYPIKYKTRKGSPGNIAEYYTVLRLAEQYLIEAEADANGAGKGKTGAIANLNIIRVRAGLLPLSDTVSDILGAIKQERRIELFAEWGHRWLDLRRWDIAVSTLDTIPLKRGNINNDQLWYPIPLSEIQADPNLIQNPGYASH